MKYPSGTTIFLMLMTFSGMALAQSYTLSGTVRGGTDPLAGATVNVKDSNGTQVGSTLTDASGHYSLSLANDTFTMSVIPPEGSPFGEAVINDIVISGADVTRNVVLIERALTLTVRLSTPDGTAVPMANIQLYDLNANTYAGEPVRTDADGTYVFSLAASNFFINVWGRASDSGNMVPGYFYRERLIDNFSFTEDTVLDITLPLATISGRIYDHNGNPVPGADLHTLQNGYSPYYYADNLYEAIFTSDADGYFSMICWSEPETTLSVIPPHGSQLAITAFNELDLSQNLERDFHLGTPYNLSGFTQTPSGENLPFVNTALLQTAYPINDNNNILTPWFQTEADGSYSLYVAEGIYQFNANTNQSNNTEMPSYIRMDGIAENVVVTADTVQDLVFPLIYLTGRITDPSGNPIEGVTFYCQENIYDGGYRYIYNNNKHYSDANGYYRLPLTPHDDFDISVNPPDNSGFAPILLADMNVQTDTVQDIVLGPPITFSLSATYPDGSPMNGLYLQFYYGGTNTFAGVGQFTDANGYLEIELSPGTYDGRYYGGKSRSNGPTPGSFHIENVFELNLTQDTHLDHVMPFTTMSGKTTDSNGVPVPGVNLSHHNYWYEDGHFHSCSNQYSYKITSDADGDFQMHFLSYAAYDQNVQPPDGSGFAQTIITDVDMTTDVFQNIILGFIDTQDPLIIAGPYITNVSDTTATVEWQTNEPATTEILWGTSSAPTTSASRPGFRTQHRITLENLTPSTRYFVQALATDRAGNGPVSSRVVDFVTDQEPDTQPPLIVSGPTISGITHNSLIVNWETNEPADGIVEYGTTDNLGSSQTHNDLLVTHAEELTGLQPDTLYFIKVGSSDAVGNGPTYSHIVQVYTLAAPDTEPPLIIAGPMVINITDTEATVIWETNEPATSGVSYNDGTAFGVFTDPALVTEHSVRLTGLTPDTVYNYTVSSTDGAGNGPTLSDEDQFRTLPLPDTEPPVIIEGPIVLGITHQSAVIRWRTDEPSDSVIEFGTDPNNLDQSASRAALVSNHNLPLTGLLEGVTYYFRVSSTDAEGNGPVTSEIHSFTTRNRRDNTPPEFTVAPTIIANSDTTATLYWETDEPADALVRYGEGSTTRLQRSNPVRNTKHTMVLAGLVAGRAYTYTVEGTDMNGNTAVYENSSKRRDGFTTSNQTDTTAPVFISAPQAVSIAADSALIVWETNEPSDSRLVYRVNGNDSDRYSGDLHYTTYHVVVLANLSANTTYQVDASSFDVAGNGGSSDGLQFTTLANGAGPEPFILSGPDVPHPDETQAEVVWTTNIHATSGLVYGLSADSMDWKVATTGLTLDHSLTLTHLEPGVTYYYQVSSTDNQERTVTSEIRSFATAGDPVSLSVSDVNVDEGDSGTVIASFLISLDRATSVTVTVDWFLTADSATANVDYEDDAGTLSFAPGETSQQLDINVYGDQIEEDTERFSLDLSDPSGAVITDGSGEALITDDDQVCIQITAISPSQILCAGGDVTLSVSAIGSEIPSNPTSYQWQKDEVDIAGATEATLTLANLGSDDTASYRCIVGNNCGNQTSDSVALTIDMPLNIVSDMSGSESVCGGEQVTYSIDPVAGARSYNWSLPPGATLIEDQGNSITVSLESSGDLSVTAENQCGQSDPVNRAITVTDPPDTAIVGDDVDLFENENTILAANDPAQGSATWLVRSGPDLDPSQFSDPTDPGATFTPAGGPGTYVLDWTISNLPCSASVATKEVVVWTTADLSLDASLDKNRPNVGDLITVTLTLQNQGPSSGSPEVTLTIPAGLQYQSHVGTGYLDGTWAPGAVADGAATDLAISFEVVDADLMDLSAEISQVPERDPDSQPGNGQVDEDDLVALSIEPLKADLDLASFLSDETPSVGDLIRLELTLSNAGPDEASGVTTQITLPANLSVEAVVLGDLYDPISGAWTVVNLAVGSSAQLHLDLRLSQHGADDLSLEIQTSDVFDPDSTPGNGAADEDDLEQYQIAPLGNLVLGSVFKAWLVEQEDIDVWDDGEISPAEALAVTTLDLTGLNIDDFTGLADFANLTALNLSDNQLHVLPPLQDLNQLQVLRCRRNYLRDFHNEADSFTLPLSLRVLEADRNRLQEVPLDILGLTELENLSLAYNNLYEIPGGIDVFENLQILDVTHNRIESLPAAVGALPNLTTLLVYHNQLHGLPEFVDTPQLQALIANHNRLEALPDLSGLNHLLRLNLAHNRIADVTGLSANTFLCTQEAHIVKLSNNWLDDDSCAELEILNQRANLSGSTFAARRQGNFNGGSQIPDWSDPLSPTPLLDWVLGIGNGQWEHDLGCEL